MAYIVRFYVQMKEKIASPGGSPYKTLNNGSYDNNEEKSLSLTTKASGKNLSNYFCSTSSALFKKYSHSDCFLKYAIHKFRSTIGKARAVKPNENVLLAWPQCAQLHAISPNGRVD